MGGLGQGLRLRRPSASPALVAFPYLRQHMEHGKPPCQVSRQGAGLPGLGIQQGSPVCVPPQPRRVWILAENFSNRSSEL